jgi:rhamnosyltransferase
MKEVSEYAKRVITRKNVGRDFGSWKLGLEVEDYGNYNQVILANDSVYGPLHDLSAVFEEMEGRNLDMWGITESWEYKYHLQSYFLVFEQSIIESNFFEEFWNNMKYLRGKKNIIKKYEIGVTERAILNGFDVDSYIDYSEAVQNHLNGQVSDYRNPHATYVLTHETNPMHFLWETLINEFNIPFIKIGLLRDNPSNIPMQHWESVVSNTEYNVELAKENIKRRGYQMNHN